MFSKSFLAVTLVFFMVCVSHTNAGWRRFRLRRTIHRYAKDPLVYGLVAGDFHENLQSTVNELLKQYGDEAARLIIADMAEMMDEKRKDAPIDDEFDEIEANSNQAEQRVDEERDEEKDEERDEEEDEEKDAENFEDSLFGVWGNLKEDI